MSVKIKKESVLVKPSDVKPSSKRLEVIGVLNPGGLRLPNGDILIYLRVIEKLINFDDDKFMYSPRMSGKNNYELTVDKFSKEDLDDFSELDFTFKDETKRLTYISHFRKAILSPDGFKVKSIDKKPSFFGLASEGEYGIEDPRITKIDNNYVMAYVTLSKNMNVTSSMAISNDGINWKRKGIIFEEQNKDVAIFPEKVNGKYAALNRPEGNFQFSRPDIIISYSNDLNSWGWPKQLILSDKKSWDSGRVGAGPPPIKTDKGWLTFYHGVIEKKAEKTKFQMFMERVKGEKPEDSTYLYSIGVALLDLNDPSKVISKSKHPIITPSKKYEKVGLENKEVVFSTTVLEDLNGKDYLIFSGGGDVVTTVKKISKEEINDSLESF